MISLLGTSACAGRCLHCLGIDQFALCLCRESPDILRWKCICNIIRQYTRPYQKSVPFLFKLNYKPILTTIGVTISRAGYCPLEPDRYAISSAVMLEL